MILSGCAGLACRSGPLQQQLSWLEASYDEAAGNVARGYALHVAYEEVIEPYTEERKVCEAFDSSGKCTLFGNRSETKYRRVWENVEKPVAIDILAEREKLDSLSLTINELRIPAEQEYFACIAEYERGRKG